MDTAQIAYRRPHTYTLTLGKERLNLNLSVGKIGERKDVLYVLYGSLNVLFFMNLFCCVRSCLLCLNVVRTFSFRRRHAVVLSVLLSFCSHLGGLLFLFSVLWFLFLFPLLTVFFLYSPRRSRLGILVILLTAIPDTHEWAAGSSGVASESRALGLGYPNLSV